LHDHHTHPLFYAAFTTAVNLQDVCDRQTAARLMVAQAASNPSQITVGHGWRSNSFEWPQADFEKLPPGAVFDISLHSLRINRAGSEILGKHYGPVTAQLHDRLWYERNLRVVLNWFANLNATVAGLKAFYDQLLKQGVWSAEELLLVDEREIELFDQAGLADRTRFWAAPDTFAELSNRAKAKVAGLKLFTDGALGARTAALRKNYLDEPGNWGMLIYGDRELLKAIEGCLETGKPLAIHAIGDRAIEQSLTAIEELVRDSGAPEIRIEHAQLIDLSLAQRAKKLGLTLSMQPNFNRDSVDYRDRLAREYCVANNPFRMLIDDVGFTCGQDLILGSDGMPHGIESAIGQSRFPPFPGQELTIDEFRAGYCLPDLTHGHIELEFGLQEVDCKVHTV
jgi:predicted amidohydrolase YtcJ